MHGAAERRGHGAGPGARQVVVGREAQGVDRLAVGVAGELGVGVGLAALLGIAADKITTAGIEQGQVVYNGAVEHFQEQVDQFVQNNPGPAFDPFDPGAWFDQMMGIPHYPNEQIP